MPDITSSMKEDKKGPKNREITLGLGYSKNTVRISKIDTHKVRILVVMQLITAFYLSRYPVHTAFCMTVFLTSCSGTCEKPGDVASWSISFIN